MTSGTDVTCPVTAVVPVKRLALAKSRLGVEPHHRRDLALAFALDTVAALSASPLVAGVLAVTSDPLVARHLGRAGVPVVAEDGVGLEAAAMTGMRAAIHGSPRTGVAVVPADLPCLRPDVVTRVLTDASRWRRAFVPDRFGTGTTLVVHGPGAPPVTGYGPGSAARHALLGLHPLSDAPREARHDVDTLEDLKDAWDHGAGPATRRAVEAIGLWPDDRAS